MSKYCPHNPKKLKVSTTDCDLCAYEKYEAKTDTRLNFNVTERKSNHPNSVAAEKANRPYRSAQAIQVKEYLRDNGPHTCEEISDATGVNYTTVSALLSILKGRGGRVNPPEVVETGEKRKTRRSNFTVNAAVVALASRILPPADAPKFVEPDWGEL